MEWRVEDLIIENPKNTQFLDGTLKMNFYETENHNSINIIAMCSLLQLWR